jgi:hypothetical protein
VLKAKLLNFSRITNKDNARLYELLDIRSEIQSLMMYHIYIYIFIIGTEAHVFVYVGHVVMFTSTRRRIPVLAYRL